MQNTIKPSEKLRKLKLYISGGDVIYRKIIEHFGFKNVERALYNYCNVNKLSLRKVNDEYWVKDYTSPRINILLPHDRARLKRMSIINTKKYRLASKKRRALIKKTINLPN